MGDKCEMFVKGPKNKKIPFIYLGVFVICVLVSFYTVAILGFIGMLIALLIFVAGALACVKIIQHSKVEFEYSAEGGELRISVIRNQTSRKELLCCDIKEIGSFGTVSCEDASIACKNVQVGEEKRLCCIGEDCEKAYYFNVRGKDGKSYKVYFTPSERFLEVMAMKNINVRKTVGNLN